MYLVCRTIGLSDYRTVGLLDSWTITTSDLRSDPIIFWGILISKVTIRKPISFPVLIF